MLKFCPYCGAEILRQDVKFCMNCGKSLAEFMNISTTPEPPAQKQMPNISAKKSIRKPTDTTIEQELVKCRESAEEGYRLAAKNYNKIKDTLVEAEHKLDVADNEQNQFTRIKSTELVDKQKGELKKLTGSVKRIRDDLHKLHERSYELARRFLGAFA